MPALDRAPFDQIASALGDAWNAGDGAVFARCFTEDADFVNIFAMYVRGREAIAKQHQFIFDGMYRGSTNVFTVVDARELAGGVVLARIAAKVQASQGPLAGVVESLATAVFLRTAGAWLLSSFHNTRVQPPPG